MAGLDPQFGFERRQEGVEVGQTVGIGLVDDVRQILIDQRREYDRAHAVTLALAIDAGNRFVRLGNAVEEGNADLREFHSLELAQEAVPERFGRQAGAVGDEEHGTLDRGHANRCCAARRRCR